ncbi:hypothetical protein [Klebsiella quasipneumoniae]|uniref:hypothetical protein n=1 Tax=Klebsiella quasipneumoniae TaxID=1463165 RepID=UPI00388D10A5
MDKLMTAERRDLLNNVLRIGGFMTPKGKPKVPEALFKTICESLGLKTDKRRAGRRQAPDHTVCGSAVGGVHDGNSGEP